MANDIPHDEASPGMEADPEHVPLPPRVRPFDLETYYPEVHMLPPDTIRHFRGFARGVPEDLLLREPESHLSYGATKGDSHSIRGYGATSTREWYMDLPVGVRQIVDEARFDLFCIGLLRYIASRSFLGTLVERWWDTTNSFHFSTVGDITMTPYDFVMLTSIEVKGRPIPYDTDMDEWEATWIYLLGARPPLFRLGMVRYTWFADHFRGTSPKTLEEIEQYARGFLMFLFGTTLFVDRANTVGLYLLSALVDLSRLRLYDWGGAGLATLYSYMSSTSRRSGNRIGSYWRAWEVYFTFLLYISCLYAYFLILTPEPEVEMPPVVPYPHRYESRLVRRTRETFSFFRQYFDTVTAAK
ncbi:Protein MAIN-LIKE 2, partial [Camellia lanceoleosa]